VDSWIWSVRLAATRPAASGACRAGHVRVNGVRVKPAHAVRAGDEVRLRGEGRERVVVVQQVITKRVSASAAAACYIDNSPPPPPRQEAVPVAARDRGAGRPTKRERRSIEKLLGRPARWAGLRVRREGRAAARRAGVRACGMTRNTGTVPRLMLGKEIRRAGETWTGSFPGCEHRPLELPWVLARVLWLSAG
jgi:ribosome-associated heat shock protein Hsp15